MKKITPYRFDKKAGLKNNYTNNMIRKRGSVGSDILKKIKQAWPDIDLSDFYNIDREQIIEAREQNVEYMTKDDQIRHIEKRIELLEKYMYEQFSSIESYIHKLNIQSNEKSSNINDSSND